MINNEGKFRIDNNILINTDVQDCIVKAQYIDKSKNELKKILIHNQTGNKCTLIERIINEKSSLRYEVEVKGDNEPWSEPIITNIQYAITNQSRFWTAWANDPISSNTITKIDIAGVANGIGNDIMSSDEVISWNDPLVEVPFCDKIYFYGAPYYTSEDSNVGFVPFGKDLYCISMATIVENGTGISFINSLDNLFLDETMKTTADGEILFSRIYHRICKDNIIKFSMHIVKHEGSWRGGLRWINKNYPAYFNSDVKHAGSIVGGGAYSTCDANLDMNKLGEMAFKVNWKASFDFPYMGMFIPPSESWLDFKGENTSIERLANYSDFMHKNDCYVLNYFNVTEFGNNVEFPFPKDIECIDEWKNSSKYISKYLKDSVLYVHKEDTPFENEWMKARPTEPFYTWENSIVLDCGVKSYKDFLIEQAQKHVDLLPKSSGICIDRMDWLRFYNFDRDDGVSFVNNEKASSIYISWNNLMKEMSEIFHKEGKVVYCNNHLKRLDLLKDIDGFFDEFTYAGASLNTTALLGINKAVIGWVRDDEFTKNTIDKLLQRFLYMGVLPIVPVPGNDHCVLPNEEIEKVYMDYAPMFKILVNKKWYLEGNFIKIKDSSAKVNIFKVKDGYAIVIINATLNKIIMEINKSLEGYNCEMLYPGGKSVCQEIIQKDNYSQFCIEGKRGCALLHLKK